ncbi:ABC-three component system protein [Ensifer aridi]|uniref:ABC-three component system protein n=1 Tax=Ensifer aridi TaxID=1708715 RepID=UPI000A115A1A|nr:ABC-three component system protein [Ensifer aridi]
MKFAYEDLSEDQFEKLIVLLCQRLLGMSVKGFAKGPDGGRDAKFVGTAELHPSRVAPWAGTVIVQAKHTNGYNRHFGEADFYSTKSQDTVIGKEIPRITNLRKEGQLDHYMLFANRRLAGNADQVITQHIAKECGLPEGSIYLCGLEQLELFMKQFPEVPGLAELDPVDSPLIVSPDELAIVVEAIASHEVDLSAVLDAPPAERTSYEAKNALNNMTSEYAAALRKRYLKDTAQIRAFLAAPENLEVLKSYEAATEEFHMKIISKRKDFQNFDAVMEYLLDLLFQRDPILRQKQHKRLTRAVLFYMYWNCDIGEVADAEA